MLSGTAIARWLDVELPKSQNLRMDLLGEAADGTLHHFEIQSRNEHKIEVRMGEYCMGTIRLTDKFPKQYLIYVGEAPLNMPTELRGPDVVVQYRTIDIRELDGDALIASPDLGDNVIAILARLRHHRDAVRSIVARIADRPLHERGPAMSQLLVLAGLRKLEDTVRQEVGNMSGYINLMENTVIGPMILERDRVARLEGELKIVRVMIQKRFGPVPEWANTKLGSLSAEQVEALSERLLDAPSLEQLLP